MTRDLSYGVDAAIECALQAMDEISSASAEIDHAFAAVDEIVVAIGMMAANAKAQSAGVAKAGRELAAVVTEFRGLAHRSVRVAEEIKSLARVTPAQSRADFVAQAALKIRALAAEAAAISEFAEARISAADRT